jgi:hypothetical protein
MLQNNQLLKEKKQQEILGFGVKKNLANSSESQRK